MKEASCSEVAISTYKNTCHNPEDHIQLEKSPKKLYHKIVFTDVVDLQDVHMAPEILLNIHVKKSALF
jgi:hypothetical protein